MSLILLYLRECPLENALHRLHRTMREVLSLYEAFHVKSGTFEISSFLIFFKFTDIKYYR